MSQLEVHALRPKNIEVAEFPGYLSVRLTKRQLDLIIKRAIASWKGALASVGGGYLISDAQTGRLYVGSATGDEGWASGSALSWVGYRPADDCAMNTSAGARRLSGA